MNLITKKVFAASAAALMLLPAMASAHEGRGLHLGTLAGQGAIHANTHANVGHQNGDRSNRGDRGGRDNDNDNDGAGNQGQATSTVATSTVSTAGANASSTVEALTKKATGINGLADFMGSLSGTLASRIASSSLSASSTATANAQLADYNASIVSAKAQVAAALAAVGGINAANATSTNAGFAATAQADLGAARNFLDTARQDLRLILQALFSL